MIESFIRHARSPRFPPFRPKGWSLRDRTCPRSRGERHCVSSHDKTLDKKVVLKEHYPQELCTRDADSHCLIPLDEGTEHIFAESVNQFIREARLIASLEHPSIIKIHRVFSFSSTTYFYT